MKGLDMTWSHVLILALLITQIVLLVMVIGMMRRSATDVKQTLRMHQERLLPFGGPYEACEDQICPNYDNKKECMVSKEDQIKKCCEESCKAKCAHLPPEALQECLSACTPTFR